MFDESLKNIDIRRGLSIWPHFLEGVTITHLPDEEIKLPPEDSCLKFYDWLVGSQWASDLESNLQCMCETEAGEPLLTTWLDFDDFAAMAEEARAAGLSVPPETDIARWREKGATQVDIEGFADPTSYSLAQRISKLEDEFKLLYTMLDRLFVTKHAEEAAVTSD